MSRHVKPIDPRDLKRIGLIHRTSKVAIHLFLEAIHIFWGQFPACYVTSYNFKLNPGC